MSVGTTKETYCAADCMAVGIRALAEWQRKDSLSCGGHPVNSSGLKIYPFFRSFNAADKPAFERLFAAGFILTRQNWMRRKCGSGLAISSAYAVVDSFFNSRLVVLRNPGPLGQVRVLTAPPVGLLLKSRWRSHESGVKAVSLARDSQYQAISFPVK